MKTRLTHISWAIAALISAQSAYAQLTTPAGDDSRGLGIAQQFAGSVQSVMPVALSAANQRIAKIRLITAKDSLIADGQTQALIRVEVLDNNGKPIEEDVVLTLEATQGLINLKPGEPLRLVQDKHGRLVSEAEAADIDELTPGIQIKVKGVLEFSVVAPFELKDVQVRVTGGAASELLALKALPDLRDMIAVGVIEGQLRFNQLAKNLVPANEGDLFERELKRVANEFGNGKGNVGGRAAFFLKGKILGEYLLTAAADSEKDTQSRLFKDIDPNAFYPVYGEGSLRGSDAQSKGRLFVRIDKDRSYLLYGDFNSGASSDIFQLGNFSRSATGLKWHYEDSANTLNANAFASYDNLTQFVDEMPGRGISGPYSLGNPNGVAGTERVELIVRDRNQPNVILRSTSLVRQSDYEFEPFSGKILFKSSVPSVDENFNPVSIRISYEVEQGGQKYWVGGANAEWQIHPSIRIGASAARDNNPQQNYGLSAVGLRAQLAQGIRLTAELAHSDGTPGGVVGAKSGDAKRIVLDVKQDSLTGQVKWLRSDAGFDNPASGLAAAHMEFSAKARYEISKLDAVRAEITRSQDYTTGAERDSALLEYDRRFDSAWSMRIGIRHAKDSTGTAPSATNLGSSSGICSNFSGYNGGFGVASSNGVTDTLCNNGSRFPVAPGSLAAASPNVASDSVYARLGYQPREVNAEGKTVPSRWSIFGEAEVDVRDNDKRRFGAGVNYQWSERTKLYARFEDISSVTGLNGLSTPTQAHMRAFSAGVSSDYAENAQVYNEYRLNSAISGKQAENAVGLRNGFLIAPGLKLSTSAELIKVLSGTGSDATALGAGLDYTASKLWKASGRIEWRQDNSARNWLSTAKASRQLDTEWTLLAQNYLSITENRAGPGRKLEDRFLIGAAYRPMETNTYNMLTRYEHRTEQDSLSSATQPKRTVDILSLHGDWHPQRVWHINGRVALKHVDETFIAGSNTVSDAFAAWLLGARVMYDLSDRWSVGAMASVLQQTQGGKALQFGYGLEAGYAVTSNLWFNLGYTWRGLNDKDLLASEYRNKGFFVGLRMKFDENLWGADNPRSNKSLEPK
jgi:opacity protein-like surface antigen